MNKGYELRVLIDKQADRLRINIGNWWERQYQLGIVPPQMGDFFRPKKPKHDVNANVELNAPNPNKTPDVKTDLETSKTDADLKSPDKVVDRGGEGTGNHQSRNVTKTSELNKNLLDNLTFEGTIKSGGRSGGGRPLYGTPNSYVKTEAGHTLVYDAEGRLIYDISSERLKMTVWDKAPNGTLYPRDVKLAGSVPSELLK